MEVEMDYFKEPHDDILGSVAWEMYLKEKNW